MQTSRSLSDIDLTHDHQRIARAAILNGVPVPPVTITALEARGINYAELEARILSSMEFRR